jgi:hypothetical protein
MTWAYINFTYMKTLSDWETEVFNEHIYAINNKRKKAIRKQVKRKGLNAQGDNKADGRVNKTISR